MIPIVISPRDLVDDFSNDLDRTAENLSQIGREDNDDSDDEQYPPVNKEFVEETVSNAVIAAICTSLFSTAVATSHSLSIGAAVAAIPESL